MPENFRNSHTLALKLEVSINLAKDNPDVLNWLKANFKELDVGSREHVPILSMSNRIIGKIVNEASQQNNLEVIKWCIQNSYSPNASRSFCLQFAVQNNNVDIAGYLIDQGACVNDEIMTYQVEYRRGAYIHKKKISSNPIDYALEMHINTLQSINMIPMIQLLLVNDTLISLQCLSRVFERHLKLIDTFLDDFFITGSKDLQLLSGSKLLLQFNKYQSDQNSDVIKKLSALLITSAIELDFDNDISKIKASFTGKKIGHVKKYANDINAIQEALKVASSKLEESNPELSIKVNELSNRLELIESGTLKYYSELLECYKSLPLGLVKIPGKFEFETESEETENFAKMKIFARILELAPEYRLFSGSRLLEEVYPSEFMEKYLGILDGIRILGSEEMSEGAKDTVS